MIIFISYRRKDSIGTTGRIFDRLSLRFGATSIFKDIDSIRPGEDFRVAIDKAIRGCRVLLAVIGPDWPGADEEGRRRIDDPDDYVHVEIAVALQRKIPLIPVLVGNRAMPRADELPGPLRELAFKNAVSVRDDPDFRTDIEQLCERLEEFARPAPGRLRRRVLSAFAILAVASLAIAASRRPRSPHHPPVGPPPLKATDEGRPAPPLRIVDVRVYEKEFLWQDGKYRELTEAEVESPPPFKTLKKPVLDVLLRNPTDEPVFIKSIVIIIKKVWTLPYGHGPLAGINSSMNYDVIIPAKETPFVIPVEGVSFGLGPRTNDRLTVSFAVESPGNTGMNGLPHAAHAGAAFIYDEDDKRVDLPEEFLLLFSPNWAIPWSPDLYADYKHPSNDSTKRLAAMVDEWKSIPIKSERAFGELAEQVRLATDPLKSVRERDQFDVVNQYGVTIIHFRPSRGPKSVTARVIRENESGVEDFATGWEIADLRALGQGKHVVDVRREKLAEGE